MAPQSSKDLTYVDALRNVVAAIGESKTTPGANQDLLNAGESMFVGEIQRLYSGAQPGGGPMGLGGLLGGLGGMGGGMGGGPASPLPGLTPGGPGGAPPPGVNALPPQPPVEQIQRLLQGSA